MAKVIQLPYDNSVVLPVSTAQSVQKQGNEKPISLEALGLLVNLISYPSEWDLFKTELYKRFGKNGEKSVRSAWNELTETNYIIEFKHRVGKKYEYVYYLRKVPFTPEEKAEILAKAEEEFGAIWGLRFEESNLETSKGRGNQKNLLNKDPLLNNTKDLNTVIDDDKRTPSGDSAKPHDEESVNNLISNLREETKDELSGRSFKAVVRKVMDKYNQGKVGNLRDYLVTALANKIYELELRKAKDQAKVELLARKEKRIEQRKQQLEDAPYERKIPFYDWLNE